MTKKMIIDAVHLDEARVAILHDDELYDYDFVTTAKTQLKGNVFLAKITRVEPSLQAAFVEYGGGRQGFLPFSEIHPDYYHMPVSDKQKLLDEQIAEAEAEEAAEEEAFEREQAAREHRKPRGDSDADADSDHGDAEADVAATNGDEPTEYALEAQEAMEVHSDPIVRHHHAEDDQPLGALPAPEPFSIPQDFIDSGTDSDDTSAESFDDHTAESGNTGEENRGENAESSDAESGENANGDNQESGERRRGGRPQAFYRRYRIQEVIKRNQIVLVQVTKEERGNKGCSLTTYVSLAGRYCVLMPNSPKGGGISRKITDRETRKQLKSLATEMRTHRGMSVIIRTAGIDRARPEIRRDYEYLVKLWNKIREETLAAKAPAVIYEEGNLIKRAIRDLYTSDIESIEIEGEAAFEDASNFMGLLMPAHVEKICQFKESTPIFTQYGVEEELEEMLEPQVKLPSGGYIVINPTEALISIDVNSGRSTTERNVEETALKTNLEAAREVARQMRLRDLAGLIVIDFIDMNYGKNRRLVERAMRDALKEDRAKIQLGRISIFGLLELSRQRMRPSMSEAMGMPCPSCKGTGIIHSLETVAIQIVRTLQKEAASGDYTTLRVSAPADVVVQLLNEKRAIISDIETRHAVKIIVSIDATIITASFRLVKLTKDGKEVAHEHARAPRRRGRRGGTARRGRTRGEGVNLTDALEDTSELDGSNVTEVTDDENTEEGQSGRSRRGRRGGRNRRERGEPREPRAAREPREPRAPREAQATDGEAATAENTNPDGERERRPRGRRGRRGGRGREGRSAAGAGESSESSDAPAAPYAAAEKAPRTSHVIPLNEASAHHSNAAEVNPSAGRLPDTAEDPSKPKRKGWWNRVLEN